MKNTIEKTRHFALILLAPTFLALLAVSGCEKKSEGEKAIEEISDGIEEAADEVGDAVEDATN